MPKLLLLSSWMPNASVGIKKFSKKFNFSMKRTFQSRGIFGDFYEKHDMLSLKRPYLFPIVGSHKEPHDVRKLRNGRITHS
jgi:hypothetical protein